MPKLTKSIVDAATPREKQFTIWCSELKGFGIFVLPSGSRTYFVDYRNRDGVRKRMTIGRHGRITAEEARKLAIVTLGETVKRAGAARDALRNRRSLYWAGSGGDRIVSTMTSVGPVQVRTNSNWVITFSTFSKRRRCGSPAS
jgi:hypothetical protein